MEKADRKIISWMLRGSVEFNQIAREVDLKILGEAVLPHHKKIYRDITAYFSRYKSPPPVGLLEETINDLDEIILLKTIVAEEVEEGEIGYYLDKIKDRYNEFLLRRLAQDVEMSKEIDLSEFNSNIVSLMAKIERLKKSSVFSEGDVGSSVQERYDNYIYKVENPNEIAGVMSGYRDIDDYTYGIKNSEMMTIIGQSSSGKSLLMLNIAANAWLGENNPRTWDYEDFKPGKNVIYFSLEMSKSQLEERLDAKAAFIRHKALSRGYLSDEEFKIWKRNLEFQKAYKEAGNKFFIVDMPRGSRAIDIEARLEAISSEFTPDLVCIDYLGIMKPNKDFGQDWLEVGHCAADIHELCRKKDLPFITAAQKKARDKKSKKNYNDLEEIGRSKMIGDNTNIALIIESRDEEHLREDMPIHIAKNRDGAKGVVYLQKAFERSSILDFPENWVKDDGEENEI